MPGRWQRNEDLLREPGASVGEQFGGRGHSKRSSQVQQQLQGVRELERASREQGGEGGRRELQKRRVEPRWRAGGSNALVVRALYLCQHHRHLRHRVRHLQLPSLVISISPFIPFLRGMPCLSPLYVEPVMKKKTVG